MSAPPSPLILHVIHHLHIGGLENGLVNLVNNLPAGRYRHAIACIEDYSDFRDRIARPDVQVYALHRSQVGVWGVRRALYRLCRELRPAIVHSRNMSGLDALLPARLAGVPHCVHGEHGWDVDNLTGEKFKPALLRQLHAPMVSRYITVSQDLRNYLLKRVRIAPHRIVQIYNGVDTARFAPRSGARTRLPEGFAPEGSVVFGTVGRLQPVKDQATLLRAFAALLAAGHSQARLVVVGAGPLGENLRRQAGQLGIAGQTWFAGALEDVPAVLRELDVFVLPSLSEGISNTILEAMACGLPVLATGVGGNVELLTEGSTGRLFRPRDDAALARHMAAYLADPVRLRSDGAAARADALARFSLQAMMGNYAAVYDEFLARPA